MQLLHSYKSSFIVKTLICLSILNLHTPISLAENPAPSPPPVEPTTIQAEMPVKEYKKQFTEKKCTKRLQEFPYYFTYEFDTETNSYNVIDREEEDDDQITDLEILFSGSTDEDITNILQIQAACLCIQMGTNPNKALSSTPPQNPDADPDAQAKHLKYLGIKDWINTHIQINNETCKRFQTKTETPDPPPGSSTKPEPIVYSCAFDPDDIEIDDEELSITQFRSFDSNNNCEIDDEEKCAIEYSKAVTNCQTANEQQTIMSTLIPCPEIRNRKWSCIKGDIKKLTFSDGDFNESLKISEALQKEGQDGFIKFFSIEDNNQGAGTNNPAINLILYVINLLAGLSFLIAVAMLILGGFYLVMASGNSEMTDRGKKAIQNFIYAIIFTLLSYTIVTIIQILLYS